MAKRKNDSEPATMTVKELAERLGTGLNQTYRAVNADQFPTVQVNGRKLPLREPIMRMLRGETAQKGAA